MCQLLGKKRYLPRNRFHKVNQGKGCTGLTWQHWSQTVFSVHSSNRIHSELMLSLKAWEMAIVRGYRGAFRSWRDVRVPLLRGWNSQGAHGSKEGLWKRHQKPNSERKLAPYQEIIKQQNTLHSRKATYMAPGVIPLRSTGRGEDIILETYCKKQLFKFTKKGTNTHAVNLGSCTKLFLLFLHKRAKLRVKRMGNPLGLK